jgi:hypothetical protein
MGYLLQSSSGIADCTALTISTWVRLPSTSAMTRHRILAFGPSDAISDPDFVLSESTQSQIIITTNPGSTPFGWTSVLASLNCGQYFSAYDTRPDRGFPPYETNDLRIKTAPNVDVFSTGAWHHLLLRFKSTAAEWFSKVR